MWLLLFSRWKKSWVSQLGFISKWLVGLSWGWFLHALEGFITLAEPFPTPERGRLALDTGQKWQSGRRAGAFPLSPQQQNMTHVYYINILHHTAHTHRDIKADMPPGLGRFTRKGLFILAKSTPDNKKNCYTAKWIQTLLSGGRGVPGREHAVGSSNPAPCLGHGNVLQGKGQETRRRLQTQWPV